MSGISEQWLGLTVEEALEPELEICDPHHHLWDYPGARYMAAELLADIGSGHRIVETVYVECLSKYRQAGPQHLAPVGETEFVLSASSGTQGQTRIAAGIVAYADLTLGARVDEVLQAHAAIAGDRFVGIRHAAAWHEGDQVHPSHHHPTAGLMGEAQFREGFARLAAHRLAYDAWIYHTQLRELAQLADASPETTIVLDHVGTPLGIGPYKYHVSDVLDAWKPDIAELSKRPNVVVKLGGLGMAVCGLHLTDLAQAPNSEQLAQAFRPYVMHCIDCFGPTRCMFESNFPVDKVSCSYGVLWNAFKRMTSAFAAQERADLFRDTARRVYRLA